MPVALPRFFYCDREFAKVGTRFAAYRAKVGASCESAERSLSCESLEAYSHPMSMSITFGRTWRNVPESRASQPKAWRVRSSLHPKVPRVKSYFGDALMDEPINQFLAPSLRGGR